MKKPTFPKYAVGEEWPEGETPDFVVRLRNPFVLASVEPQGFSIHLHAWPDIREATTPVKVDKIMATLARLDSIEHDDEDTDYSTWSYSFGTLPAIPPLLMLDNTSSQWTGILRLKSPMGLWQVAGDLRSAKLLTWLEDIGQSTYDDLAKAEREVNAYLTEYLDREEG